MLRKFKMFFSGILMTSITLLYAEEAVITKMSGEVKVRRGLEEEWVSAAPGTSLDVMDTILTLEGKVLLKIQDGTNFELGENSILDISDLRRVTKREMFLYLMSAKVNKIQPRSEKTKLRVGNVSVVHGESKLKDETVKEINNDSWSKEFNGAVALFDQQFYTNTVIKLSKIKNKNSELNDCGQVDLYLAKSFEHLNEPGQALDAYQTAFEEISKSETCQKNSLSDVEAAIQRLKK